jgi:hypothetical protein
MGPRTGLDALEKVINIIIYLCLTAAMQSVARDLLSETQNKKIRNSMNNYCTRNHTKFLFRNMSCYWLYTHF